MIKEKGFKVKSLSEQRQKVANIAMRGVRTLQLISIITLSAFLTTWVLSQFGVYKDHAYYNHLLIGGILISLLFSREIELQIQENTILATQLRIEGLHQTKDFGFTFFVIIGFLTISIGGSWFGREDLADNVNHYETQAADSTVVKATAIVETAKVSTADDLKNERSKKENEIKARYQKRINTAKKNARDFRKKGDLESANYIELSKIPLIERERDRAIDRAIKPIEKGIKNAVTANSTNIAKALDLATMIEENRVKSEERKILRSEQKASRHKNIMGYGIVVSAPMTVILLVFAVTLMHENRKGKVTPPKKKAKSKERRRGKRPTLLDLFGKGEDFDFDEDNDSDTGDKPDDTDDSDDKKEGRDNVTKTGLTLEEYRELRKGARDNYRLGITRKSDASLAKAEEFIIELAKHGFMTIKGKKFEHGTRRIIKHESSILVDDFDNPSLEPKL